MLHLMNWTANEFERNAWNEYRLSPVENASVRIRKPESGRISNPRLLVDAPFERREAGDSVEVLLPKVGAYQAIAFEME